MKTALKVIGWIALILVVLALLLLGALRVIFSYGNLSENEIIALVEENEQLLRDASAELQNSGYSGIIDEENVSEFSDTVAKSLDIKGIMFIRVHENGVVEFNCGGSGFGSETEYYGFYYSTAAEPENIISPEPLTQRGKDRWVWHEDGGDNAMQAEKIFDDFYYYISSF